MRGPGAIRWSAAVTLALLAAYELLRLAAQNCSGAECDAYIPVSLIVPLAILIAVAVTGWIAISHARHVPGGWVAVLSAVTVVSLGGPIAAAAAFRDQPDIVVPLATVLFVLTPCAALLYSVRGSASPVR